LSRLFLTVAARVNSADPVLRDESFVMAQRAARTEAAAAVAQMSARYAAKDSKVAEIVRELQDLQMKWRAEDRHLKEALGVGNITQEDDARKKNRQSRRKTYCRRPQPFFSEPALAAASKS
jgi:hypothetical protein